MLNHNGDFKLAARDLGAQGYGKNEDLRGNSILTKHGGPYGCVNIEVDGNIWELWTAQFVIKDDTGKSIYKKIFKKSSYTSDRVQQAIARDIASMGICEKNMDARKILLPMIMEGMRQREALLNEQAEREKMPLLTMDIKSGEVWEAIKKVGVIEQELVEIAIATCVSLKQRLDVPIWLIIIGNPSSVKTEMVKFFTGLTDHVEYMSSMTENAFASGYVPPDGSEPQDLLGILDGKALLIRDLTTMLSLNEETVKKILGDLVSIFDGCYEKFTGTRGKIKYKAVFPIIACVTPAILSKHESYMSQLGSRFLCYRVKTLDDKKRQKGREIAWSEEDRRENIKNATIHVSSFCLQIMKRMAHEPLPVINDPKVQDWLNRASDFVSQSRGIISGEYQKFNNDDGREVIYYEICSVQMEEPWRALNQLRNLVIMLAFVREKSQVTLEECNTIRGLILATAPVDRAEVLNALSDGWQSTAKDISVIIGKSDRTVRRKLKELVALKLVEKIEPLCTADSMGKKLPAYYQIDKGLCDFLDVKKHYSLPQPDFVSMVDPQPEQAKLIADNHDIKAYKDS